MAAAKTGIAELLDRIREYRTKFYQNQLLKGVIFSVALLFSAYLFVNTLEYFGRFSSPVRGILLLSFLLLLAFSVVRWVITPIIYLSGLKNILSDEEAAVQIGHHFPEVGDKLLNTLQLGKISNQKSDLIEASIKQKSNQLMIVRFSDAVHLEENKKYLKYAIFPLAAISVILLFNPRFFAASSERIINFNQVYNDAPFSFNIQNSELKAFRNEDFTINLKLSGEAIPEAVYLVQNNTRFKLTTQSAEEFTYTFKNIQRNQQFRFEAAGFRSESSQLTVIDRPELLSFDVKLNYPSYLNKPSESLNNVGNLTIPEGTTVEWHFNTSNTNALVIRFEEDSSFLKVKDIQGNQFDARKTIRKAGGYSVLMENEHVSTPEKVTYYLDVIPDQYPQIAAENFQDTTLYNYLVIGGTIADDYGFSNLKLMYTIENENTGNKKPAPLSIDIPFSKDVTSQSFYFQWYLDSLNMNPGDKIEYYAQVWDNDGVNGAKSSRSQTIRFTMPDRSQITKEIDEAVKNTESQITKALEKAQSLKNDLNSLENRLKSNRELEFQEKRQAEEIIRKRESLMEEIKNIQEENQKLNEKSEQFNKQSPEMREKLNQLEQLLKDMSDDETNKLYDQLEKLLDQKKSERMTNLLEKLKNKQQNSEKELERTLKLFKQLQLEQKMENLVNDLEDIAQKEEELSQKTLENDKNKNQESKQKANEELTSQQEKIQEEFKNIQENMKDAEKLAEDIGQEMTNHEEGQNAAEQAMEKSKQQLSDKKNKQAAESQKKAAENMKKMAQSLEDQMEGAQMAQMQMDMDVLRDILENLIKASFDQEQIMNDFKGVSLQDPRFVTLGQQQLKLMDDAKIIEDSLYSLANRVVQIQSFITRELNDMKMYMNESIQAIRDRHLGVVAAKQQFSMTSMNNLALMLSDVFKQMQDQMAMAMSMPGSGKNKKPGDSQGAGEMQQKLNDQIKQMGEGSSKGKDGKGMSEQLARMAAEQAQLRKMIQELMNEKKGTEIGNKMGNELKEIMDLMDKSETDLVNKRVNPQLINRNNHILTRLLESEKAIREQDEDDQRKGQSAKPIERKPPAAFEQYIRDKEKQTELLRSIPPTFSPYYKKQVDAYFKKYQGK